MKRFLGLFFILILSFSFVACNVSVEITTPEYSTRWTSNGDLHWRNQLNGNGRTDVAEHVDDGTGTCPVCEYVIYLASFANEWSYDDEFHWKEQTNGTGIKDKASHVEDSGKCKYCAYYYDATEFLKFEKCTIGGVQGYRVVEMLDQDFDEDYFPRHIEVPTHYQGLPVISIGDGALSTGIINGIHYNDIKILSVKLNEGLLELRQWAFKNTEIKELVIPNSTTNQYFNTWGSTVKGVLYNVANSLDRLSTGGIRVLGAYNFGNGVKEVVLGSSLQRINTRAFYEVYSLEYLVIPASVNSIPEGTIEGSGAAAKAALIRMLPDRCTTPIYMEITKAEHDALLVDQRKRDLQGNVLDPLPDGAIGFVKGWSGNCPVYFKGEWKYNKWGKPYPIV